MSAVSKRMVIEVLLFGPALRIAGRTRMTVEVDERDLTCRAVKEALRSAEPRLAGFLAEARLAVNRKMAGEEDPIAPGDEVALIGMVNGG